MLAGLVPGPLMMAQQLDLVFALLTGVAIANIMGGLICIGMASYISRIALVPLRFLFPTLLAIILVAAVATEGALWDILVCVLAALLGLAMKRFDMSRVALALGFVLGQLFEYYFFRSLKLQGPLFFLTPGCAVMVAILIFLFSYRYWSRLFQRLTRARVGKESYK